MELKKIIQNARERLHVEQLTPMQSKMASLPLMPGAVTLIAPTGSGKTLGFALQLLQRVRGGEERTETAVVVPSRELALQIARVLTALGPGLRIAALYGGHSMIDETRSVQAATPDIVVGTPGRLLDHLHRRTLNLRTVRTLVLDEYDKSLELGFRDEMQRLVRAMPAVNYLILTSATCLDTLPDFLPAKGLTQLDFSAPGSAPSPQLEFYAVKSPDADMLDTLIRLLGSIPHERTLIFVNHRESAERVFQALKRAKMPAVLYHGALEQRQREQAVDLFANGSAPIMVATDLAARGLDIPQVSSVIHYHQAINPETDTHRNGRAARMGAEGAVYRLIGPDEATPEGATPFTPKDSAEPWAKPLTSLYFYAGRKEKLSKGDIVGALTQVAGLQASQIGQIALHDHHALVAVDKDMAAQAINKLNAAKIKGKRVKVVMSYE